ncbi:ExbD/TolR family protein [Aestuariibius insulae]|uniref:ExbD/TolR family protein n=1 Tax=Aestuariibius insulae TaxID=2058287 RepID=UPI00345EDC1F
MLRRERRKRRLSMTSLIDVIFLLLLFFMLSSTFSRFAEVELASAPGQGDALPDATPAFLQVETGRLALNGTAMTIEQLTPALIAIPRSGERLPVLVSLRPDISSQRLIDVMVVLRGIPGLSIAVLGQMS